MDKLMAQYCDIVMDAASKFGFPVHQSNTSIKGRITLINWQKAVDYIKSNHDFIEATAANKYYITLNSFGKSFINEGNSFIKMLEEKTLSEQVEKAQKVKEGIKFDLDYLEAQRKNKWFYPLLFVSFFGLIGTILGIWNTAQIISEREKKSKLDKNIYLLIQQQKADSIHALQMQIQNKESSKDTSNHKVRGLDTVKENSPPRCEIF